jgi:hypothetical protein
MPGCRRGVAGARQGDGDSARRQHAGRPGRGGQAPQPALVPVAGGDRDLARPLVTARTPAGTCAHRFLRSTVRRLPAWPEFFCLPSERAADTPRTRSLGITTPGPVTTPATAACGLTARPWLRAEVAVQPVDKGVDGAVETSYAQGINNGCPVDDKRILKMSGKGLVLRAAEAVEILSPLKTGSASGETWRTRKGWATGTDGGILDASGGHKASGRRAIGWPGPEVRRGPSISYMEGPRRYARPGMQNKARSPAVVPGVPCCETLADCDKAP